MFLAEHLLRLILNSLMLSWSLWFQVLNSSISGIVLLLVLFFFPCFTLSSGTVYGDSTIFGCNWSLFVAEFEFPFSVSLFVARFKLNLFWVFLAHPLPLFLVVGINFTACSGFCCSWLVMDSIDEALRFDQACWARKLNQNSSLLSSPSTSFSCFCHP